MSFPSALIGNPLQRVRRFRLKPSLHVLSREDRWNDMSEFSVKHYLDSALQIGSLDAVAQNN